MPVVRMVALAFAKTFSKLFGLVTITFFGRAPSRDDDKVGVIGLLSIIWVFVVVAVFIPALVELMLPFLPDEESVLRGVAISGAVAIPPVIGVVITRLENRLGGAREMAREAVFSYGSPAADPVGLPGAGLRRGQIFRRTMSRKMKVLSGHIDEDRWFEVTLHATDLSVIGRKEETTYIMAILSEELDERNLYFSWDDSSQALEDRIRHAQDAVERGEDLDPQVISELCEDLRERALSTEEWNAIRRQTTSSSDTTIGRSSSVCTAARLSSAAPPSRAKGTAKAPPRAGRRR